MTGLDLESFLLLLRADLGVWLMLGLAMLGLAFLVWSSWRSHTGTAKLPGRFAGRTSALVVFGTAFPGIMLESQPEPPHRTERPHIREIRVATLADPANCIAPESLLAQAGRRSKDRSRRRRTLKGRVWTWPMCHWHLRTRSFRSGDRAGRRTDGDLAQSWLVEQSPAAVATAEPRGDDPGTGGSRPRSPGAGRDENGCTTCRRPWIRCLPTRGDRPNGGDRKTVGSGEDGGAHGVPMEPPRSGSVCWRYDLIVVCDPIELSPAAQRPAGHGQRTVVRQPFPSQGR